MLGMVSAAHAAHSFTLEDVVLAGNEIAYMAMPIPLASLTQVSISFRFDPLEASGAWASDMVLLVGTSTDDAISFGGFNTDFGISSQGPWAFDGAGSAGAGIYTDSRSVSFEAASPGPLLVGIGNGWITSGPVRYTQIQITLTGEVFDNLDCNGNGISGVDEIAAGAADCNANGFLDACEFGDVVARDTGDAGHFGAGAPLEVVLADPALGDVSIEIDCRADLGGTTEFVTFLLDDAAIESLWVLDGVDCPDEPATATVVVPRKAFNAAIADGVVVVRLETSPQVAIEECPSSHAAIRVEYLSELEDCNANGLEDPCEFAGGTAPDCDADGIIDVCAIANGLVADCDGSGVPDSCEIADGTLLDCNGDGAPDTCDDRPPKDDCDGDGISDACEIAVDPSLDENGDGVIDACSLAVGDFDLKGIVGGADLSVLLSLWGTVDAPIGDLNDDGLINGYDLAILLSHWGPI
jgi:hypothetical protein